MDKIKLVGVLLGLLVISTKLIAQNEITKSVRATGFTNRLQQLGGQLRPGDMISGFSSTSTPDVIGDVYWDKHWGQSSLLLYSNPEPVEGYLVRYDIYKDEFEFSFSSGVKVIRGSLVKDLLWRDSVNGFQRILLNAKEFSNEKVKLSGFLELLVEGKHSLYKKVNLEVLKPDFNPALNVGSKDYRINKKVSYYYNTEGRELVQVKSKKDFQLLINRGVSIDEILRTERPNLKQEADLVKLFSIINE